MIQQQSVKVSIRLADGAVAIMTFLTVGRGNVLPYGAVWKDEAAGYWEREPSHENIFDEINRCKFLGSPVGHRIIDEAEIPADRTFRDALVDDGVRLTYDMPKAREIHRQHLRMLRAPLFEANDIALRDAILDDDKEAIAKAKARRDALRDVTDDPAIEAAETTDELKKIVPTVLAE